MKKLSTKAERKISLLMTVFLVFTLSACKKDEASQASELVKVLKTQNPLEGQLKALKQAENLEAQLLKMQKDRLKLISEDL